MAPPAPTRAGQILEPDPADGRSPRHALVTGGSSGLGLAIARACVRRGVATTLVARDADRLATAADSLRGEPGAPAVETLATDVARPGGAAGAVRSALDRHGRLDLVVHAAGASARGHVLDCPRESFERLLALNFLAAVELAQASADALSQRRGSLVLIGSLASMAAPAMLGAYPTSKFPLAALAQQLRLECGPRGMHTLLVCPGPLARSDSGRRYDDQAADLPESARLPGAGVRLRGIDPELLADRVLDACDSRRAELVIPRRARLLFALGRVSPAWGDWLLERMMRSRGA